MAVGTGLGNGEEVAVGVSAATVSGTAFLAGPGSAAAELGVRVGVGAGLTVAVAIAAGVCVGETPPVDAAGEPGDARAATGTLWGSGLDAGGLAQAPRATKTAPRHSSGPRKPRR